jgi:hypothetical protein
MARDAITLGEVTARGVEIIEIRRGRCDRAGRLSVARVLGSLRSLWGDDLQHEYGAGGTGQIMAIGRRAC